MPLVTIVLVLIVVGVLLWLINAYIPMARPIKTILNIVVIIAVVLWILSAFGISHRYSFSQTEIAITLLVIKVCFG
jgi:hypothetical protein